MIPLRHGSEADDRAFERHLIHDFSPSLNTCNASKRRGERRKRKPRKGRRERKKSRGAATSIQRAVTFTTGEKGVERSETSLLEWLEREWKINKKKERTLTFGAGQLWIDGLRKIKRNFGLTKVRWKGQVLKLEATRRILESGATVTLQGIARTTTATARNLQELRWLLRKPRMKASLPQCTTHQLVGLYRAAGLLGEKKTKNDLRLSIDKAIRIKTGIRVRKRVTVKVKYDSTVLKQQIRTATEMVVDRRVDDAAIASLIKRKIRVVWKRNKTVGEIIHNQREYANTLKQKCGCRGVSLPRAANGHVLTRFSDLEDVPMFLRNSRNVTCSSAFRDDNYIKSCIKEAALHLPRDRTEITTPNGGFKLEKAVTLEAWEDKRVKKWALRFQGLVLAPIDRNQGDTTIVCPLLYRHAFGKTFTWNVDYESCTMEETEILRLCKRDFMSRGLKETGEWRADGRIGRAYIIPKDKDLERWRPIAPVASDPTGVAQKRAGRALHCLVKRLPKESSFYLNSTQDLATRVGETEGKFVAAGCTQVEGRCYDIKDMFTKIPHETISVLNPPRAGKRLLVLDVDYTIFDHRSTAETPAELQRPYLHEFLTACYAEFDLMIWSATSMKWVEVKMRELGVLSNPDYKITALLDHGAMITVTSNSRVFDCKPLAVIWAKFPEYYHEGNTVMFDDLRRNFVMNPKNGLVIRPFRKAHLNRDNDRELVALTSCQMGYFSIELSLDDCARSYDLWVGWIHIVPKWNRRTKWQDCSLQSSQVNTLADLAVYPTDTPFSQSGCSLIAVGSSASVVGDTDT
ncbi:hypothetical protein CBR_g37945 [Chara braunii]|uniref:FCP1 homology domain-containing protein n=1 Tax=Chara braunii TaxID=69332 RepID=A0A388LNZ8_CHABU|nr:hypothetical protein CBR_g37945 [Chara braunii]|eukprot:GBG84070.1 hypothetical protein CBR_g37945 [Chara braunii]